MLPEGFSPNLYEGAEGAFVSKSFQILSTSHFKGRKPELSHWARVAPYRVRGNDASISPAGKDVDRTTQAAQQQIAAMGAQIFEVGLFKPSAADEGRAVMIPRTWDGAH